MKGTYSKQVHDGLLAEVLRTEREYFAFAESFNGKPFAELQYSDRMKVEHLWDLMDRAGKAEVAYRKKAK
jgi:hypothetical protein